MKNMLPNAIEADRHPLAQDVTSVTLNGKPVEVVYALNVAEGWVDVYPDIWEPDDAPLLRLHGKVEYTLSDFGVRWLAEHGGAA